MHRLVTYPNLALLQCRPGPPYHAMPFPTQGARIAHVQAPNPSNSCWTLPGRRLLSPLPAKWFSPQWNTTEIRFVSSNEIRFILMHSTWPACFVLKLLKLKLHASEGSLIVGYTALVYRDKIFWDSQKQFCVAEESCERIVGVCRIMNLTCEISGISLTH